MPVVRIDLRRATSSGTFVGIGGVVTCTPTRRRILAGVTNHPVAYAEDITVQLVDGVASPTLATTDGTWCWKITEPDGTVRYISVGSVDVDYGDLPDVDPATLTPTAEAEATWWTTASSLNVRVTALEEGGGGLSSLTAIDALLPTGAGLDVPIPYATAYALGSRPTLPAGWAFRIWGGTTSDPNPSWMAGGDWRQVTS